MKQYPSISRDIQYGGPYYVFDKLDGSNIRAEWSKKQGFYKFGSRKVLLGAKGATDQQSLLGESIDLIKALTDPLAKVFQQERWQQVVCFFEFWGQNSFAGQHHEEPHKVTLIDLHIHKQGIIDTREFVRLFEGVVETPKLVHQGNFNKELEAQVRSGTLDGMTFEGVVVKAPPSKRWELPTMFKVKNQAWIDRVRALHGDRAEQYL
jgi:hypothetical protein